MLNLSTISDHYIVATTTDYTAAGVVSGYHVSHCDLMPLIIIFLIIIFAAAMWDITKRILLIIKKNTK
jgi:hypothetical protein